VNLNEETAYLVCTHHLHSIGVLQVQFEAVQLGIETFLGGLEVSAYGLIASYVKAEEVVKTHLSTQRRTYQVARSAFSV